jgi:hypothetical protein
VPLYDSKYSFELWTKGGSLLADLGKRAQGRSVVLSRNQADIIDFKLDLMAFEQYCRALNVDPKQLLLVNSTEVRVKRLGTYVSGGQLMYKSSSLNATTKGITLKALGFLALFNKRFTGSTLSGTVLEVHTADNGNVKSRTDLAWYLIDASQSLTNGSLGITRGFTGGSTSLYDKTYSRTRIKDALQDMTNLQVSPIDIEFTHNKVFNTYSFIGSNRPDIVFEFPGNIMELGIEEDGTDMTNEVIGVGAGAADGTQARYDAEDIPSQTTFQLRQDVFNSNATDNSDNGLTDGAEAVKVAKANPIKIPALKVNGNIPPYVTDYRIGDRVQVKVTGYPSVSDINGMYRIEKINIHIDDDDNEEVTLEVSNT